MGIKDTLMNSLGFQDQNDDEYQYEEDYGYDEPEYEEEPQKPQKSSSMFGFRSSSDNDSSDYGSNYGNNMRIVLLQPNRFEEAQNIAGYLLDNKVVVFDLQECDVDTAINIVAAYETIKFGSGDGEAAAERAARYERADLLIIDDMGTEMGTAFTVSALYDLINNRLMAKRPMIINTNLLPETLSEKYSPAVASRLLGEFLPLRFFGDDIRLLKMRRT